MNLTSFGVKDYKKDGWSEEESDKGNVVRGVRGLTNYNSWDTEFRTKRQYIRDRTIRVDQGIKTCWKLMNTESLRIEVGLKDTTWDLYIKTDGCVG